MKNRFLLRVLTWLLTLAMLCSTVPAGAATSNGWEGWTIPADWTVGDDGVASTDGSAEHSQLIYNSATTNQVKVSVRIDEQPTRDNAGVGLAFNLAGETYYLCYCSGDGSFRILKNDVSQVAYVYEELEIGTWYDFTFTLEETYLAISVGGVEKNRVTGDFRGRFQNVQLLLNRYAMEISLKNPDLTAIGIPMADLSYPGWTPSDEGYVSYAGTDLGAAYQVAYNLPLDTNQVSFDLRQDGAALAGNAHMGLIFTATNGDSYYFFYAPADGYAAVKRYPAGGGEEFINPTGGVYPIITQGQWVNFRVIYSDTSADFYIDNVLQHSVPGDFSATFQDATAAAQSYATPISARFVTAEHFEDPWAAFSYVSPWVLDGENVLSYAGTDGGAAYAFLTKAGVETNYVSMDMRIDSTPMAGNANVSLRLDAANGDSYLFQYVAGSGYAAILRILAAGGEEYLNTTSCYPSVPVGEWVNFKLIYNSTGLDFYIGDQLAFHLEGDYAEILKGAKVGVSDYYTPLSVRMGSLGPVEPWTDWSGSGWTLQDDGSVRYTGGELGMYSYGKPLSANTLEFDIKLNGAALSDNGGIGPYLTAGGSNYYLQYCAGDSSFRILKDDVSLTDYTYEQLPQNEWLHFTYTLKEDCITITVNGVEKIRVDGDFTGVFQDYTVLFNRYNVPVSIRNFAAKTLLPFTDYWSWGEDWKLVNNSYLCCEASTDVCSFSHLGPVEATELSFSARVDSQVVRDNANFGVSYTCLNGESYFFYLCTFPGNAYLAIRHITAGGVETEVASQSVTVTEGEWHNFAICLTEQSISLTMDEKAEVQVNGDFADKFYRSNVIFSAYDTATSVKIEPMEESVRPKIDYDFEFDTKGFVDYFTAENGTIAQGEGTLVYTLTGTNSVLSTPEIFMERGDKYSALASVKNTVFLRLKNSTDATALKVTVLADLGTAEVIVPMESHSDFTSYFANCSEYELLGYIRQVKLEPVGASSGSITLESLSFERENELYDYAGSLSSCLADFNSETVTVKGTVEAAYAGQNVKLYVTTLDDYHAAPYAITGEVLAETIAASDGSFTMEFPLKNDNMTRLSDIFLLGVGKVLVDDVFYIENGADYETNPYAFEVPDYTVSVLDFGAKGDSYNDDTDAIQAAVDHVAAHGGGVVVIPGDDSFYGRRYVITNIKLCSNLELRIEEGAMLWQSPRAKDYDYEIYWGHNKPMPPPAQWTESCQVAHRPLLEGIDLENIRITGGGTIRLMDYGVETYTGAEASQIWWVGDQSKIHVNPIGLSGCVNVEISDISILRSNSYHAAIFNSKYIYCEDVWMAQATCASADCFGIAWSSDVFINHNFTYSNDDAIVICSSYNDPRKYVSWWGETQKEFDYSTTNVTVLHNNIQGRGHGLTIIPWCTNVENLEPAAIKDIYAEDNQFCWMSGWFDDPFYGDMPFDNTETDDFGPVQQVRIFNNKFKSLPNMGPLLATDVVTDTVWQSHTQFLYADFERYDEVNPDWVTGLANWTVEENSGSTEFFTEEDGNHAGKLTGTAMLAQGLYMPAGDKTFSCRVKLENGSACLIVKDILSGKIIAQQELSVGGWKTTSLSFTGTESNLYIGVEGTSNDCVLYLDNCKMEGEGVAPLIAGSGNAGVKITNNPVDFGWETDEINGKKDFSGWTAHDVANLCADYEETTGNHRVWKSMLSDQNNFTVSLDYTTNKTSSGYVKIQGLTLELDGRHGNGGQAYVKFVGNTYDWVSGKNGKFHIEISRVDGGDIQVSIVGEDYPEDVILITATPTESNENVELGIYEGTVSFNNVRTSAKNYYTVTWIVGDKTITQTYEEGMTPFFNGNTSKPDDENCTYVFSGWDKKLLAVTDDVTYTAQYTAISLGATPADFGWDTDDKEGSKDFSGWTVLNENNLNAAFSAMTGTGRIWKSLLTNQNDFTAELDIITDNTSSAYVKVLGVTLELDSSGGDGNQSFVKLNGQNQDWVRGDNCEMHVKLERKDGGDLTITVTGKNGDTMNLTAKPTEDNENLELGLYRGIASYKNITVTCEAVTPATYLVTFVDGLTGETIATDAVEEGKAATAPEAPAHEGYTFKGWDKDFSNLTADLTVTAQYEKNEEPPKPAEYTVTFVDGLTGETISAVKVEEGKAATAPEAPTHEGYTFKGWDKDFSNVTADLTVTAQYEKNEEPPKPTEYTVTFVDGLTNETISTVKVEEGKAATAPEAPAHEGYTFKGWDKDFSNVTADLTVTAQYEKNEEPPKPTEYTVTFVDGLTNETISTVKVEEGKAATAPEAPAHEGYTFKGWDKDLSNVTTDLTVTALYEKNEEPPKPWVNPFKDVKESDWYYEGVKFAAQNELFNGTSPTTFEPDGDMTRAMLVTVLWRLDGKPAPKSTNSFKDVPSGQWYTEAVAWASENGVVDGVGNNLFEPDGNVTREQIAAIMYRYAGKKGYDTTKRADLSKYPDEGQVSSYAKEALSWANAEGLINGTNNGKGDVLDPKGSATRAQVATILMRYVENIVE